MNNKLIPISLTFFLFLSVFGPGSAFSSVPFGGFVTYEDTSTGLSMQYPENWKKSENNEEGIKSVVFTSPSDGESDEFFENITIVSGPTENSNLEDTAGAFIEGYAPYVLGFKIIDAENLMISGIPAYRVIYDDSEGYDSATLKGEFEILITNKQFFIVNFIAESTYPNYDVVSQKIIDSMKIDSNLVPKLLSGKYSNTDFGVEVNLPTDWISLESIVDAKQQGIGQMTAIISIDPAFAKSKNPDDFVSMGLYLSKMDQLSYDQILSGMDSADCQMSGKTAKIVEVNGMKALEFKMKCNSSELGRSIDAISHSFITPKNIVYTSYQAGSQGAYTNGFGNFKNYESSLKIQNTLDLSDPFSGDGLLGVKVVKNSVTEGPHNFEVVIGSDSTIDKFTFNEDTQEISFKVSGKLNSMGYAEVHPGGLLIPPYKVAIDGKTIDKTTLVQDTTNNSDSISFSYQYPVSTIAVSGQQNPKQPPSTQESVTQIPSWIKNNAKWWAEDSIGDQDFTKGIQFLIKEKIMKIPQTVPLGGTVEQKIPNWIKNNAKWWSDDQITDGDFVKGIQYLVEHGIIVV